MDLANDEMLLAASKNSAPHKFFSLGLQSVAPYLGSKFGKFGECFLLPAAVKLILIFLNQFFH